MFKKLCLKNKILNNLISKKFACTPEFLTVCPKTLSEKKPHTMENFLEGKWVSDGNYKTIIDPLNGEKFIKVPEVSSIDQLRKYKLSLEKCPKSGLHNPLKNVSRYLEYGRICFRASQILSRPEVEDYFTRLIQRVVPKSYVQCQGEVILTQRFLQNFSGDSPRLLAKSFGVAGDHDGQFSQGYRFPFGPVSLITPFNFPLEIPGFQLIGALIVGNKVLVKVDSRVSIVMEQFIKLLHEAGMPLTDCDFLNADGKSTEELIKMTNFRMNCFTGSQKVADKLAVLTKGKIRLEDAGFDWKILGPDVHDMDQVAFVSDQDAFGATGQKCTAQSIVFAHKNWVENGLYEKLKSLASRRNLKDLTVGPVLTWTTEEMLDHIKKVLEIPGARLLFGGKELKDHSIPKCYGALEPTAVFIPLEQIASEKYFDLANKEVFGPYFVITEYENNIDDVLGICERMQNHLSGGIVSNDPKFYHKILANTVNGVTYVGIRARTTGAPPNHWFGPGSDPRAGGIGSWESILTTWTGHREVIQDFLADENFKTPNPS